MSAPRPVAVLDANVLVPPGLRDLMLSMASEGAFRPVWQEEILDELHRNFIRLRMKQGVEESTAQAGAAHLVEQITKAFPDGTLDRTEWEPRVEDMTNQEKDRHVLAAADAGGASHLVTSNIKDFPAESIPDGISVVTPNAFACMLLDEDPETVIGAVEAMSSRLTNPPMTPMQIATVMTDGKNIVQFGQRLLVLLSI